MNITYQGRMFSLEDFHAKTFRWLGSVEDWLGSAVDCGLSSIELLQALTQDGLLLKMSPAFSIQMRAEILPSYLEDLPESYREFLKGAGEMLDLPEDQSIQLHTAFSMHNILEFPRDAAVCSLWQVLEQDVPKRYFLSPRAARGILRRAEKRGKELPETLKEALVILAQAGGGTESEP